MSVAVRLGGALFLVTLLAAASPGVTAAQSLPAVPSPAPSPFESGPSSSPLLDGLALPAAGAPETIQPATTAKGAPRGVLMPLYVSFAALQALDAHSTLRAIDAGASERNPFLTGIVNQPAAFIALKGGVAASTIFVADKLRHRSRTAAIVTMVALNSVYATVVAHNYRAVP